MKHLAALADILLVASLSAQSLDPTFDGDGIVQTSVNLPSIVNAVTVQSNGRILVAGNADTTGTIVRYMPDGSLDASFGTGGVVVLDILSGSTLTDIAVLSSGKIVVVGTCVYNGMVPSPYLIAARFNSNGTVDNTFGGNGNGRLSISLGIQTGSVWEVLVQPDGKILMTATTLGGISTGTRTYRLLANGTYDSTFGSGGEALWGWVIYNHTLGRSIALQTDGKVLVGGWLATNTESDRFVRRLTAQGELDATYADNGLALFDAGAGMSEMVSDILLQNDGKLLMVGSVSSPSEQRIRVTRLLADGSVDTSYGTDGELIGPVVNGTITPKRGCLQADGKLVFATNVADGGTTHSMIWRVDVTGTLDPTFGLNGQLIDPCGSGANLLNDVAQQSDGKLIIGGQGPGALALTTARLSSEPVGLEDLQNHTSITIAPNPNDGRFLLRTGQAMLERLEIVDMQGRLVHAMDHVQGDTPIDLTDMQAGNYMLRAITAGKVTTLSFIKH